MLTVPEVILADRNGQKINVIENLTGLTINFELNGPHELSFQVDRYLDGHACTVWDQLKDFKLACIPSMNLWFELYVSVKDSHTLTKSVTGTHLNEAELSQILIYGTEINTESDILRPDYQASTLYNPEQPEASILHRLLQKAPHYTISHVDAAIADKQRTFTFDGISVYDAFQKISEELNCLFVFGENAGSGKIPRTISVYDLDTYGEDTAIFASVENLSDSIDYSTNVDSVKNCFHLEAGDDLMTAAVRNCSPSGSPYLWYLPEETRQEMSAELRRRLSSYDELYGCYETDYELPLPELLVTRYNSLIGKYQACQPDLKPISPPVTGYSQIMQLYYDVIDFHGYLDHVLMPAPALPSHTAAEQAALLTDKNLSPIAVQDCSYITLPTAESAIISYARIFLDTAAFQVSVSDSQLNGRLWTGRLMVKSYSDEEDAALTDSLTIQFNDDLELFVRQKMDKLMEKQDTSDLGITGLFKQPKDVFSSELKKHCLSNLSGFHEACGACIDILIGNGIADRDAWLDTEPNLYDTLYSPYLEKLALIEQEIQIRTDELAIISSEDGGLKEQIDEARGKILKALDLETYLGSEGWTELSSFRREDSYSNPNYSSEGLSNAELIQMAREFLSTAREEIFRSATLQHTISSTLKNLTAMEEFKPLLHAFRLGNWIRIGIDRQVYKLRLISYSLDFDSPDNLKVDFSDVIKAKDAVSDTESILSQAKSMASSYPSVIRQAEKGALANTFIDRLASGGLNLTSSKIISSPDNQDLIFDQNGLLCRRYDEITGSYDPEQVKLINKGLYFTDDGWQTAKAGIGTFEFYNPMTKQTETGYGVIANTIIGNIMLSETVGIYNKNQSVQIDNNGFVITTNPEANLENLFTIQRQDGDLTTKLLYVDDHGNLIIRGEVVTNSGTLDGQPGLRLQDQYLKFYAWFDQGQYLGEISNLPSINASVPSEQVLGLSAAAGDLLSIGVRNENQPMEPYITLSDHELPQPAPSEGITAHKPVNLRDKLYFDGTHYLDANSEGLFTDGTFACKNLKCSTISYVPDSGETYPFVLGTAGCTIQLDWNGTDLELHVDGNKIGTVLLYNTH